MKKNLILKTKEKCESTKVQINKFYRKFYILQQRGLPSFKNLDGQMIIEEKYEILLNIEARDKIQFGRIKG